MNTPPYYPEENGKIERYNQTYRTKCIIYGGIYPKTSLEEKRYKTALFLGHYNYKRRYRELGMNGMTPIQKINRLKV